jgi:hypothetical protein
MSPRTLVQFGVGFLGSASLYYGVGLLGNVVLYYASNATLATGVMSAVSWLSWIIPIVFGLSHAKCHKLISIGVGAELLVTILLFVL